MEFLVSFAFCVDLVVLERKQNVNHGRQLFYLRIYVRDSNLRVDVEIINFAENHNSENTYLWVKFKSVLSAGVASLPAIAEPTRDFVQQQVRVEAAVEI